MRLGSIEYPDAIEPVYELYMQELFIGHTFPLFRHCLEQNGRELPPL